MGFIPSPLKKRSGNVGLKSNILKTQSGKKTNIKCEAQSKTVAPALSAKLKENVKVKNSNSFDGPGGLVILEDAKRKNCEIRNYEV